MVFLCLLTYTYHNTCGLKFWKHDISLIQVFLPESGQQPVSGLEPDSKESYLNLIYLNQV